MWKKATALALVLVFVLGLTAQAAPHASSGDDPENLIQRNDGNLYGDRQGRKS